ncbi:MAG: cytochrome c [Chitinophagaceae bacterium]|nr:cytochrome c [Chitinophagaceae bacterium]
MKQLFAPITLVTLIIFVSCAKKTGPANSSAAEAPKPKATSYTTDVLPLLQARCTPCHFPSKGGNKANFETYATVSKFGAAMLERVQKNPGERGFMPMRNPKLSEAEIATIKKWVEGGLAEN